MQFIDSHTHLYLEAFDNDRDAVIERAIQEGVNKMILPNIDSKTIEPMMELASRFPGHCFPAIGLHPTSVDQDFSQELDVIGNSLKDNRYIAIGETGIDLYWDKSHLEEQKQSLLAQIKWAKDTQLPIIIHSRSSFEETYQLIASQKDESLQGVFHSFSGSLNQARKIIEMGFKLGIGGVLTYKKSALPEVLKDVSLDHIILETDSPFLAPVPKRGKRNESSFLPHTAEKIAAIKGVDMHTVADATSQNAKALFKLNSD